MSDLTRDMLEAELQKDLEELEMKGKPRKKTTKKAARKKTSTKKTSKKAAKKTAANATSKKTSLRASADTTKKKTDSAQDLLDEQAAQDQARSQKVFLGGLALVIILFIALLVGGKYLSPAQDPNTLLYNDVTFTKDATHWSFQWERQGVIYTIPLRFNPLETEEVMIKGILDPKFNKQTPIYITFDPVSNKSDFTYLTLGAGELSFNLVQALGKEVEAACAVDDNGSGCANRTIINCDNSEDEAVIFLKTEEPAGIFIEDTCIVVQGTEMELLRSVDRLLYEWYGIIN